MRIASACPSCFGGFADADVSLRFADGDSAAHSYAVSLHFALDRDLVVTVAQPLSRGLLILHGRRWPQVCALGWCRGPILRRERLCAHVAGAVAGCLNAKHVSAARARLGWPSLCKRLAVYRVCRGSNATDTHAA